MLPEKVVEEHFQIQYSEMANIIKANLSWHLPAQS